MLAAGTDVAIPVSFTVNGDAMGAVINWAEISSETAIDENGVAVTGGDEEDIDSMPDSTNFNQDGETNDLDDDNVLDEDDHDPELINIITYDLALVKTLPAGAPSAYSEGDAIEFIISVSNQGTVNATIESLVDYLPAGLTLNDPNWSPAGAVGPAMVTYNNTIALAPTDVTDISINVTNDGSVT